MLPHGHGPGPHRDRGDQPLRKACPFCDNHSRPGVDTCWSADELVGFVRDCASHGVKAVSFGGASHSSATGASITDALVVRGWEVRDILGPGRVERHALTEFARVVDDRLTCPAESLYRPDDAGPDPS